ncbi:MAG: acyl carrier protein [Gammaproteobacteria bacterium]
MIDQIIEQLKHLIIEQLNPNLTPEEIDADASILEGALGLDSIMVVALINLLEERFAFTFAEDELNMESFATLRTLAHFIAGRRMPGPTT